MKKGNPSSFITGLFFVLLFAHGAVAQSTSFSFQGSIQNGGSPASGNHDFEFALFDALGGGSQLGSTLSVNNVAVANGIFSVQLDFGNQFPGANRFLEIRVRPTGQPGMTVLAPRQLLNSSPYSVKSLTAETATTATNAAQLGGVAANQYVVTTDPRMTDARAPTAGSTNYVQNTVNPQAAANFNVSGSGTVGGTMTGSVVRAINQFNIGNSGRFLSYDSGLFSVFLGVNSGNATMTGTANTFLGNGAGSQNTTGFSNTFVGQAGGDNTTGNENSFFGYAAGSQNDTGSDNSFFGRSAGHNNSSGSSNSFFGYAAGNLNTTAGSNSFFGYRAGYNNTGGGNAFFGANAGANSTGSTNSFFGNSAGGSNSTGQNNAFFGANAGAANTTALGNSFFGANAGAANLTGMGNSFFGASAGLVNTGANNSFFGTVAGVANTTGFNNAFFGHWAGHDNLNGDNNAFFGRSAGEINTTGNGNTFFGANAGDTNTSGSNNTAIGNGASVGIQGNLSFATAIGAGSIVGDSNTMVLGRGADTVRIPGDLLLIGSGLATRFNVLTTLSVFGAVSLFELGQVGSAHLCRNSDSQIATCSSSGRYKTNIAPFGMGLDLISRLRPVSFDWKKDGMHDLGLVAEEVAEVEPLLTTTNAKGEIEGVKYDRVGVVLVNAVKEQQAEIESLRRQVEELKALICLQNPSADLCGTKTGQRRN